MLTIVLPIAGRGSRFVKAGFQLPKPLIPVHGVPMIRVVVDNLSPRSACRYVFLALQEHIDAHRIDERLRGIVPGCEVVPVRAVTEGAACTVLLAREFIDNDEPMMIANSDQFVDADINDYLAVMAAKGMDGMIMTFWSDHPKWSYCRMDADGWVTEVVEKQVVSNEATVGIYNFRRGRDFVWAAERMIARNLRVNNEFYVAPTYNELIGGGARVGVYNIGREYEQMHGLGIPEDLAAFEAKAQYRPRAGT
jgi:dTDP-glucose pyrophosphorylase